MGSFCVCHPAHVSREIIPSVVARWPVCPPRRGRNIPAPAIRTARPILSPRGATLKALPPRSGCNIPSLAHGLLAPRRNFFRRGALYICFGRESAVISLRAFVFHAICDRALFRSRRAAAVPAAANRRKSHRARHTDYVRTANINIDTPFLSASTGRQPLCARRTNYWPLQFSLGARCGSSCRREAAAISTRAPHGQLAPGRYFYCRGALRISPHPRIGGILSKPIRSPGHVRPGPISCQAHR